MAFFLLNETELNLKIFEKLIRPLSSYFKLIQNPIALNENKIPINRHFNQAKISNTLDLTKILIIVNDKRTHIQMC